MVNEVREGSKEGAEASCLILVGEKGVGKSAFLRRYAQSYPEQTLIDERVAISTRPVVYLSFPPSPTLKGSSEVFLSALAGRTSIRGSRTILTQRIKELLIDLKVEIVIADEFQHVREEGQRGRSQVADWLKDILKSTNIPFVLSGMPETIDIVRSDEQLFSMSEKPTIITSYNWDLTESRNAWRALLAKIDIELPFNNLSDLASLETSRSLYLCSEGNLRRLRSILRVAVSRAIGIRGKLLTCDDLATGYHRLPKAIGLRGNPLDINGILS